MAATYTTNTGLKKPEEGTESGVWGASANTVFDLVDEALGYASHSMPDSNDTITISNGSTATARAFFIDVTGTLTANRDLTLAPNDSKKVWVIRNSTSGGFDLVVKQGSGSSVTVESAGSVMVFADGAGAGAGVESVGFITQSIQTIDNLTVTTLLTAPSITGTDLVLDQGAADVSILRFNSSDVSTGLSVAGWYPHPVDDDTFGMFVKSSPTGGGLAIVAVGEDTTISGGVLRLESKGGQAATAKTTASGALIEVNAVQHNGAGGQTAVDANGNVFAVRCEVSPSSDLVRFLVDEDGDMWAVTAGQTFDDHDDIALLNDYDMIRSGYEGWARENEARLVDLGVLGASVDEGGMTNVTQLQRLLVGAVRQVGEQVAQIEQRLAAAEQRLLT